MNKVLLVILIMFLVSIIEEIEIFFDGNNRFYVIL